MIPAMGLAQSIDYPKILQVGILPTLSARVLLKNYQPLQLYLERELKQQVELTTATDFKTFHLNTIEGKYDVVVTAAHMARLAQTEAKYAPIAVFRAANRAVLIEATDHPLRSIQDLRGKSLAIGDRNALIVSQTINYLLQQGLREGIDYTLVETPTHNSAAYSVQSHQSVLAVSSPSGLKNIPDAIKDSVKTFAALPDLPSLIWLVHPQLTSEVPRIKAAILGFTSDMEEGKQFFDATGYIGLRDISSAEMKLLDPYAKVLSNTLKARP
jgi:phosphonate transport system substrate-binding protein